MFLRVLQTQILYKRNPEQFQYSKQEGVPLVGEDETAKGRVKIRDTQTREEVHVVTSVFPCLSRLINLPYMYPVWFEVTSPKLLMVAHITWYACV